MPMTGELPDQQTGIEEVPAEQVLKKAKNILGLNKGKDGKTQKELMAMMFAEPEMLEAAYKKDQEKFDDKELAKTLAEDRLDLSVVATIVQDKD
uniref:Nascent polypeptide-associated complex subunit alpha-like UBA domain-containing protein n=1 Tax=Panagrolaimus sp. JU765 TaxID=591449 RepID=A0AC34QRD4_9BILA